MPKVSIVQCNSYQNAKVYKAVHKAISDIGFDIKPGSKVLLKPNVLSNKRPEDGITTHPSVIDAVCRILKEKDCSIIIAESSGFGSTIKNFEIAGIAGIARKYNAKLVSLSSENLIVKKIPDAKVLKETRISKTLFDADLIINMPKMKTHSLVKYTGAVKNVFGCIPGAIKQDYHVIAPDEERFCQLLVDVYSLIKPKLSIMDGIIAIEGNGPSSGTLKKAGLIIASDSAPALDFAAEKIIGLEGKVYTTKFAAERGFLDRSSVNISGEIKNIKFKLPIANTSLVPGIIREKFFKYVTPDPVLVREKCTKCGTCAKVCHSKAIMLKPYPIFDRGKCIHCYCCHEMCPYNAIDLKRKPIIEVISKI